MYSDVGLVLGLVVFLVVLVMGEEAAAEDTSESSYVTSSSSSSLLLGMRRDNVSVLGWATAVLVEGEMPVIVISSSLPYSVPWSLFSTSGALDFFLDSLRMEEQSCARHARLVVEDTESLLLVGEGVVLIAQVVSVIRPPSSPSLLLSVETARDEVWDVMVVVMADTVVAAGAIEAVASMTKLVGEGVTVANDLDVAVAIEAVSFVTLVADGLWSLERLGCAIEVGIGEDTEENALASTDTDALALIVVDRGLIVFILVGVGVV